ncbi:MAG: hypothetical protein U1F43_14965 [Myxococcota bacterium]
MSLEREPLGQVARLWVVGELLQAAARQPELFADLDFKARILELIGAAVAPSGDLLALVRPYLAGKLAQATAVQPELGDFLRGLAATFTGIEL